MKDAPPHPTQERKGLHIFHRWEKKKKPSREMYALDEGQDN